jgi:fucose permease
MDEKSATEATSSATGTRALSQGLLLAIAYLGFISLGFPDPVAGVAWPSVRQAFSLHQSGFGLVFIALGCGYCASGFFGGKLTTVLGLGNLLWISSGLVAVAMLGSGLAPAWPFFVACGVIWGLGSGGIDAGLNAYVSTHFSARHMNWLHACYSVGATLGPLLMTAVLVRGGADSWRLGYELVGGILLAMAVLFFVTRERWNDSPRAAEGPADQPVSMKTALQEPMVWLQIVIFFLYVGLEFTVGQWSFTVLTESRGVRPDIAGTLAGSYYGAIGVGRVLSGVIASRVGLDRLLRAAMLIVLVGVLLFAFGKPVEVGSAGLVIIGLGLAPIFPCLMTMTPIRLGAGIATHAVGFQVSSGMLGAALVPGLAGLFAEKLGLEVVAQFAMTLATLLFVTHELLLFIAARRRSVIAN